MDDQSTVQEFFTIFMVESTEGIWCAKLDPPISLEAPAEEQLRQFISRACVTTCNKVFAEMYGFPSPEHLIGTPLLAFTDTHERLNIDTLSAFVNNGYRMRDAETHEVDKRGNLRWFVNNAVGIIQNKQLIRVWDVQRDITYAKRRLQQLRELHALLTERQLTVLELFAAGLTSKEIASRLKLSPKTVLEHRARIRKKLNVGDVPTLLHYTVRLGLGESWTAAPQRTRPQR